MEKLITLPRAVVEQVLEALEYLATDADGYYIDDAGEEAITALRAALETSKETNLPDYVTVGEPVQWEHYVNALIEIAELNAKLNEAKEVEPFDADDPRFRSTFESVIASGNWPSARKGDGYRSPMTQMAWEVCYATVNILRLYTHPAPASSCDHQFVTTFGGDYCVKCNEPAPSNEYPAPAIPDDKLREAFMAGCEWERLMNPAIPEGFVLVPKEPTEQMIWELMKPEVTIEEGYKDMLAAASVSTPTTYETTGKE